MSIVIQGLGGLGISPKAQSFIRRKIRVLIRDEGYAPRRAVAAAFAMARKKGYKIPRAPR